MDRPIAQRQPTSRDPLETDLDDGPAAERTAGDEATPAGRGHGASMAHAPHIEQRSSEQEITDAWSQGEPTLTGARAVDSPRDRPGVPMAAAPPRPAKGAHWKVPSPQPGLDDHLHRTSLPGPTPVAGTAQPPHGLSGMIRRRAYGIPEHRARHWALLLVADRIDVLEGRLGPMLATPLSRMGLERGSRVARSNPIGLIAGIVAGAWLTKRVLL